VFDVTARHTKIPGVILLLLTGMGLKYIAGFIDLNIPDLSFLLPLMGTLGLILIVLEGSMDLTLSKDKKRLISHSLISSIGLFLLFSIVLSLFIYFQNHCSFKTALVNAIPFSVISSAVAIPSSMSLVQGDREFIVYESSMSDIIGILAFDFVLLNHQSLSAGLIVFSFEIVITIIFSVVISGILAFMLLKIEHTVKHIVILTTVVLIYALAKLIHWPSLIVILIFGLIINNHHLFPQSVMRKIVSFREFGNSLKPFKQITGEMTFLVRSFFFLIFGFYTSTSEIFKFENLIWSLGICAGIFIMRGLFFKFILRREVVPLLFFAPRGLITILLFLSIPSELKLPFLTEGLITQTIFLTILLMSIGNLVKRKKSIVSAINNVNDEES